MIAAIRNLFITPAPERAPAGGTARDSLPLFLASRQSMGLRPATLYRWQSWARTLEREHGALPLAALTKEEVLRLWSHRSVDWRESVRTWLRWCYAHSLVPGPVGDALLSRPPYGDRTPPKYLSPSEAQRFFHAVPPEYRASFALAMFAGLRPFEVVRLDWCRINVKERRIRIDPAISKTRRLRLIEDVPTILWAQLALHEQPSGPVVPQSIPRSGAKWLPDHATWHQWNIVKNAAARRSLVKLSHDVLRHSFATFFVALTGSPDRCARILGHSDLHMLAEHYDGVATKQDAHDYFHPKPILALPEKCVP